MNSQLPAEYKDLPQYIPTVEDLQNLFPLLPPADKVNTSLLKVPVQVTSKFDACNMLLVTKTDTIAVIEFEKWQENKDGECILSWIYRGPVKYKN